MAEEIKIKKKSTRRGDDGHKVVSVRMRNEIINLLLEAAVDIVKIEE